MAGERLIKAIQTASKEKEGERTDIVTGTVLSISPLKIRVGNELDLTEKFLMLSPFCKPKTIDLSYVGDTTNDDVKLKVTVTDESGVSQVINNIGTVTIWRGLKVGDKVVMLRASRGQLFYVLQRKED